VAAGRRHVPRQPGEGLVEDLAVAAAERPMPSGTRGRPAAAASSEQARGQRATFVAGESPGQPSTYHATQTARVGSFTSASASRPVRQRRQLRGYDLHGRVLRHARRDLARCPDGDLIPGSPNPPSRKPRCQLAIRRETRQNQCAAPSALT
jgi:hypothetical protein